MSESELRTLRNADVVTEDRRYDNAHVEQHEYWTHVYTDRHETGTPHEVWIPNARIKRVVP